MNLITDSEELMGLSPPSRLKRNSMERAALVMATHFGEIAEVPVD
jgi:hypothetical protein